MTIRLTNNLTAIINILFSFAIIKKPPDIGGFLVIVSSIIVTML